MPWPTKRGMVEAFCEGFYKAIVKPMSMAAKAW
jgi:hypothetical protein